MRLDLSPREKATAQAGKRSAAADQVAAHALAAAVQTPERLADLAHVQTAAVSGETRLGAQIKYCQLLCAVGMADYAAALAP